MAKLNWDRAFALEQTAGDEELLDELMELFIDSSFDNLLSLKEAIKSTDAQAVIAAAHSLKGSSASLGIESVRKLVLEIERDARNGSLSCAVDSLSELEEQLEEVKKIAN